MSATITISGTITASTVIEDGNDRVSGACNTSFRVDLDPEGTDPIEGRDKALEAMHDAYDSSVKGMAMDLLRVEQELRARGE